ncbi:MAG: hypothetical protein U0164_08765 [Gemmatimonadaceae bacterium]
MYDTPIPPIPWQITGNHWIALPCIHPVDGSIHAVGTLHRGARAAVEFAGSERFADGGGPALSRPSLAIDGVPVNWSDTPLAWERALHWLPTFTATVGNLVVRATIFAPYGRDADTAGAVYAFAFENRSQQAINVTVGLEGYLGHRQLRVRTPRPFIDAHAVRRGMTEAVILGGSAVPGLAGMAIGADGAATIDVPNEQAYAIRREVRVPPQGHADAAFFLAVGPEGDGAEATVAVMRRRGWRSLLAATRDTLRALEQTTGHEGIDTIINRNLLFAYFYGVGRALDDAHFYLCRTRVPWHSRGVTVREWESLIWTVPAVQLADAPLARELILRACELHGYSPGTGVRYLDGTLFEPGFSLEGPGRMRSRSTGTSARRATTRSSRNRSSPTRCTARTRTSTRAGTSRSRSSPPRSRRPGVRPRSRTPCTATPSRRRRWMSSAGRSTKRRHARWRIRTRCAPHSNDTLPASAMARRS